MRKFYLSIILVLGLASILIGATFTFPPVDTDDTLTANSDTLVPSQQAVKAYVDTAVSTPTGTVNVLDYGAIGDYTTFSSDDGAMTASSAVLTCTTSRFVAGDVGKYICVHGAGTAGGYLKTTIAEYTSGTQVTLAANAATTVTDATVDYGTNSTTAISNAKTAAQINHCELYFPNGTYLTTARISATCPIRGQSAGSAIIKIDASTAISGQIISLGAGSGVRDITIDGYVDTNDATSFIDVQGIANANTSATHITIQNVNIQHCGRMGIVCAGSSKNAMYWTISDCYIYDSGYEGIYLYNVTDINVKNNTVIATGSHGVEINTCEDIKFMGNTVDKGTAPTYVYDGGSEDGFLLALATELVNIVVDGNIMQNNTTAGTGMDGIGLGVCANMSNIMVCNNIIRNTGWFGIDACSGMILENNIINNTRYAGIAVETAGSGTSIVGAKICNNTINHVREGAGSYIGYASGIMVHANVEGSTNTISNIQITGNTVLDTIDTSTTLQGITIDGAFRSITTVFNNIQVLNNDFESPTTASYAGFAIPNITEAMSREIVFEGNKLPSASVTSSAVNPNTFGYGVIIESGTGLNWLGFGYPGKKVHVTFTNAAGCTIQFAYTDGGTAGEYGSGDGNLYTKGEVETHVSQYDYMDAYTADGITWNCSIVFNGTNTGVVVSATAPVTNLFDGKLWKQVTTGRNMLWQYNTALTKWFPVRNFAATTYYVDNTDGTDDPNHGTGVNSAAFKTIQYAVDCVPPLFFGNITISVNAETYAEMVTIEGKTAIDPSYMTITIAGTLASQETASQDSAVAGSAGTRGSITDTGAFTGNTYAGYLMYSSNNAVYRPIYSHDNDTVTIVGVWPAEPSGAYTVYGWGTKIDAAHVRARAVLARLNNCAVILQDLWLSDGASAAFTSYNNTGQISLTRCLLESTASSGARVSLDWNNAYNSYTNCVFKPTGDKAGLIHASVLSSVIDGCLFQDTNNTAIEAKGPTSMTISSGTSILHSGPQGTGLSVHHGASALFTGASASGYEGIAGCTTGISAANGGQVTGTINNIYSGNTADETATAASFGYID